MRLPLSIGLIAGLALTSGPAAAEDFPPEVKGVKVVVPSARGRASWGAQRLTRSLRKHMKRATGGLVSQKAFRKAQKKLRIRGKSRFSQANLAKAGKKAGAQYVLQVTVSKKRWLYTAHAILVNTVTGEQQMDFKSGYYKPRAEAADRGKRIAKTTAGKIAKLIADGLLPKLGGDAPPADDAGAFPDDSGSGGGTASSGGGGGDPLDERIDDSGSGSGTASGSGSGSGSSGGGTVASGGDSGAGSSSGGSSDESRDPWGDSGSTSSSSGSGGSSGSDATASTTTEPKAEGEEKQDFFRGAILGGSGLLHTYDISTSGLDSSGLSYRLDPVALFGAEIQVLLPELPVSVLGRIAFSPLQFKISVDNMDVDPQPKGSIIDIGFNFNLHLPVSGSGRSAYEVLPNVGLRITTLSVGTHTADIILSSTAITPFLGLSFRMPFTEALIATIDVDGGLVASYTEDPKDSGDSGLGFQIGAGLNAKYWISDLIGIAFATRFDMQSVGRDGLGSRTRPKGENLTDPTITTKDLRASLGVAVRL